MNKRPCYENVSEANAGALEGHPIIFFDTLYATKEAIEELVPAPKHTLLGDSIWCERFKKETRDVPEYETKVFRENRIGAICLNTFSSEKYIYSKYLLTGFLYAEVGREEDFKKFFDESSIYILPRGPVNEIGQLTDIVAFELLTREEALELSRIDGESFLHLMRIR